MKLLQWIRDWWQRNVAGRPEELGAPAPIGHNQPPQPVLQPSPKKHDRRDVDAVRNESMSHYYLDDLLGDLDLYFSSLRKMRRCDPDGYAFYRRVGAQIGPPHSLSVQQELPASWRDGSERPAEGMAHFQQSDDPDVDPQKGILVFGSFKKVRQPADVEPTTDDIFQCRVYFHHPKIEGGRLTVGGFHVAVDPAGNVRELRERATRWIDLPRSKKRMRKHRPYSAAMKRTGWEYTGWVDRESGAIRKDESSGLEGAKQFREIVSAIANSSSDGFQVRVRKGDLAARFNISLLRSPYFFKNRERTVTENGKTRPIFHIVRAHRRVRAGGSISYVKTHFRGVRRFIWNGYTVVISMPGYHHLPFEDWTVTAIEKENCIGAAYDYGQVGAMWDRILDGDMSKTGIAAELQAGNRALKSARPIETEKSA